LQLDSTDTVLEIGAGTGAITEILQHSGCKRIISLEIDPRCIEVLQKKLNSTVEIVAESILTFSIESIYRTSQLQRRIKVAGNIPYHLTSDILFRLLEQRTFIDRLVIMVQQEVADRLLAAPHSKEYGIPTVLIGYYARMERLFNVGRENFFPRPRVDSTVLCLDFNLEREEIPDHDLFAAVVRQSFQARRKVIRNNLKRFLGEEKTRQIKSIPLSVRAEDLSVRDYLNLTREIFHLNKQSAI